MEFFRHCPGCGRRFQVILIDKKEVQDYDTYGGPGQVIMPMHRAFAPVGDTSPNIFDIKEFRYKYKCKHCGHEWTETRLQDRDVGRIDDSSIGVDEEGELD